MCRVILYSEVNSRHYLVASDKRVCLHCDIEVKQAVLESWFRIPKKEQKLGGKVRGKVNQGCKCILLEVREEAAIILL